MKILSINPNDGLRHCTPGTIPRLAVCLGEAEISGLRGAILKPMVGTLLIFQAGENCMSVSRFLVEKAFEVFAIEEELKIQNRFFHAIFGGGETMTTTMQGLGVMLNALGGVQSKNAESVGRAIGRVLSSMTIIENVVHIRFCDGSSLKISDEGQSCCEDRYITSDDLPCDVFGEHLVSIENRDMPTLDVRGEPHEQMAVTIQTDRQSLTFMTHNEHNGYYGGFSLVARFEGAEK